MVVPSKNQQAGVLGIRQGGGQGGKRVAWLPRGDRRRSGRGADSLMHVTRASDQPAGFQAVGRDQPDRALGGSGPCVGPDKSRETVDLLGWRETGSSAGGHQGRAAMEHSGPGGLGPVREGP